MDLGALGDAKSATTRHGHGGGVEDGEPGRASDTRVLDGTVAADLELHVDRPFTASIPLLAAIGDLRMLLRGGISGTSRITRHLWRMCYGLFIATGSFFLGQQQVFTRA